MIGLDTNILARYYIEDDADHEALRQHRATRKLIESGKPLISPGKALSFRDDRVAAQPAAGQEQQHDTRNEQPQQITCKPL